jgi:acetyl esterase/lipase
MRGSVILLGLGCLALAGVAAAAGAPPGPSAGPPPLPAHAAVAKDVVYVPGSGQPLHKLDLYTPLAPKPAAGYPLIVYVHGGGFARGDKFSPGGDDFRTAMKCLESGYMVASVNYRLSGTDRAPAQIVDVKAAVRFLKARAADYGVNPNKVVLMGVSAGASIAAAAATSADSNAFSAELAAIGAVPGPDQVAGVISLYGLYDFTRLQTQMDWLVNPADTSLDSHYLPAYGEARKFFFGKKGAKFNVPESFEYKVIGGPLEAANPVTGRVNAATYVSGGDPPFFIRHGSADENIPFLQSVDFAAALKAKGVPVDFGLVPGAQHGLPGFNFFKVFNAREMMDWLQSLR